MNNIYQTINNVMAEIGAIGKEKTNQTQGFKYRGIDDVMNALSPAFIKHKLCAVPEVVSQAREERVSAKGFNLIYSIVHMKYHFVAEDGSQITASVIGEGMDSGDKATNKAMAIAFKYACFQVFCIPTEEMKDPDAECHEVAPQRLGEAHIKSILSELARTGISIERAAGRFNKGTLEELTIGEYRSLMNGLKKTPDKEA